MISWLFIRRASAMICLAIVTLQADKAVAARLDDGDLSGLVKITIKGVILTPPPCTNNHNQTVDVDFGSAVDVSKVDGKNYLKDINYSLECTGTGSRSLSLSIQGTPVTFDNGTALDAGHGGLGIQLLYNGKKLPLGEGHVFNWPDYPRLQAVPVKKAGVNLITGEFSVGATMIVAWQ